MSTQVVYATGDVTLHTVRGQAELNGNTVYDVESVVLAVGDSVALDTLPPYQQEAVKAGKVPGAEVVSKSEADKMSADRAAFLKSIGHGEPDINFQTTSFAGPDADDGSHSDHLVPDEERRENLAARAETEAVEDAPKSKSKSKTPAKDEATTEAPAAAEAAPAGDK